MPTSAELLEAAVRHHRSGQFPQAEQLYRQILQVDPRHAQAMQLLGVLAHQVGQHEAAIGLISQAIAIDGAQGVFHANLGEAYRAAGQLEQAKISLQRAIELQPTLPQPYYNLALVHHAQQQLAAAQERCQRALALKSDYAEAHNLLGSIWRKQSKPQEAQASYERALACSPNYYEALLNLASLLGSLRQFDSAREHLQRAIALRPGAAEPYRYFGDLVEAQGDWPAAIASFEKSLSIDANSAETEFLLGNALRVQKQEAAALVHYRRAIELAPAYAEAHYNLALALEGTGDKDAAVAQYQRAIQVDPAHSSAMTNLGAIVQERGQDEAALNLYGRALEINPTSAILRFNRALLALKRGDFPRGWEDYQARMELPDFPVNILKEPLWNGEELGGRTLFVHAEQGLGDTLNFIRYLRLLEQRGVRPVVQIQPQLVELLKLSGLNSIDSTYSTLPPFDVQIPTMSLPRIFGTTLSTIPPAEPYLVAREDLVALWQQRLRSIEGFRVGICWKGKSTHRGDAARSIPLAAFEPLGRIRGVTLISLQKFDGLEQLTAITGKFSVVESQHEVDEGSGPFMDTAAIMKNLDLVVTCDTVTAHLAGSLGVPVWVALAAVADWRWMVDRLDSPWYPTMRLFRQTKLGDWDELFGRIATELAAQLTNAR